MLSVLVLEMKAPLLIAAKLGLDRIIDVKEAAVQGLPQRPAAMDATLKCTNGKNILFRCSGASVKRCCISFSNAEHSVFCHYCYACGICSMFLGECRFVGVNGYLLD